VTVTEVTRQTVKVERERCPQRVRDLGYLALRWAGARREERRLRKARGRDHELLVKATRHRAALQVGMQVMARRIEWER